MVAPLTNPDPLIVTALTAPRAMLEGFTEVTANGAATTV